MPRFAANLTMLFTEVPFLDRFERAADAGFEAVEFLFPYAFPAAEIRQRLDDHGLSLVLHNLPAGDWDAGERGIACLPDRVDEFRDGVAQAIDYAQALGVQAAQLPRRASCRRARRPTTRAASSSRTCASRPTKLDGAGLKLLIEPINDVDIPGFFLTAHEAGDRRSSTTSARRTRSVSTTSITCSGWRASWRRR